MKSCIVLATFSYLTWLFACRNCVFRYSVTEDDQYMPRIHLAIQTSRLVCQFAISFVHCTV
ncbi:unnamed protein product [Schistosoma intercalatum]|nr:unnamed protein product [Schistosoma intercalatum]